MGRPEDPIFFLQGEGELWAGGLVSIAILVLVCFAYAFPIGYVRQYPAKQVAPSTFACDPSLRDVKYETDLKSLAVPISAEERPMFDLLN